MSVNEFLNYLASHTTWLLGFFALVPAAAFLLSMVYRPLAKRTATDYILSTLIYLAAVPGMFSSILVCYSLFFSRQDLLNVNVVLYFLPILTMAFVFVVIGRKADMNKLPGFDSLAGLMILLALVFGIVLALYKLRILIGFFSSMEGLVIIGAGIFALFKTGLAKLTRSSP